MTATGVNPVFVKSRDLPVSCDEHPPTVLEVCLAAERMAGNGTVVGAQLIGGLWRIYPATREARTELLKKGLRMRGTVIQLANTNPFVFRNDTGEDRPATKVFIDNIPISVADSEVEHALLKAGCELRSAIKGESARDADGKLTRFLTGRRFLFITVPSVPLEKSLKVSIFTVKVYHKEQKAPKKTVVCSKCLEENHHASQCSKEVVCRVCRTPGHKKGDPACKLSPSDHSRGDSAERKDSGEDQSMEKNEKNDMSGRKDSPGRESEKVVDEKMNKNAHDVQDKGRKDRTRGRAADRQTKLGASLELRTSPRTQRTRSETPKRRLSADDSPGHKQATKSSKRADHPASPAPKGNSGSTSTSTMTSPEHKQTTDHRR